MSLHDELVLTEVAKATAELRADNERLTADRDQWKAREDIMAKQVERLRLLVKLCDENDAAPEVERLTAALTKIREVVGTSTEAHLIASRALTDRHGEG